MNSSLQGTLLRFSSRHCYVITRYGKSTYVWLPKTLTFTCYLFELYLQLTTVNNNILPKGFLKRPAFAIIYGKLIKVNLKERPRRSI